MRPILPVVARGRRSTKPSLSDRHHLYSDAPQLRLSGGDTRWYSRHTLSWRASNTLTTNFFLDTMREAIARYDRPQIFKTDQSSQFTISELTGLLKAHGIQIDIDDKGCWRNNVFVERL